jgi:hypothetical protein
LYRSDVSHRSLHCSAKLRVECGESSPSPRPGYLKGIKLDPIELPSELVKRDVAALADIGDNFRGYVRDGIIGRGTSSQNVVPSGCCKIRKSLCK